LRRPHVHELFGLSTDKKGLSNAILAFSIAGMSDPPRASAGLALESFIHPVSIPNLWVMPSGPLPPNPPDLLESKAMQRLLSMIASYDVEIVIFDTPPVLGLSEASILASKVDGTLVVVDMTRASKKNLKQVKALLMQVGAQIVGCVVNKQRRGRNDTSY